MLDLLKYIFGDRFCDPQLIATLIEETMDEKSLIKKLPRTFPEIYLDSMLNRLQLVGSSTLDNTRLYGPCIQEIQAVPPTIRVARIISWNGFYRYYLSRMLKEAGRQFHPEDAERYYYSIQTRKIELNYPNLFPPKRLWVTGYEELQSWLLDGSNLLDQLGIYGDFPDERWVSLSFDVPTKHLHVPTILDAEFRPNFVSKPDQMLPKAWNWKDGTWGLPEYVMAPGTLFSNPSLELLNLPYTDTLKSIDCLTSSSITHSPQLEALVFRTLRQINAHSSINEHYNSIEDIVSLSPREFELFISLLFERRGFKTTVTKMTRDNGFDIIAHQEETNGEGILIEAKHYSNQKIGIKILRELIGARLLSNEYNHYKLCIATTNQFTSGIKKTVLSKLVKEVELMDIKVIFKEIQKFKNHSVKDILLENLQMR